jgi:Amt family ammonium transporter
MRSRRMLIAASLFLVCATMPTNRAQSQSPKSGQDDPPKKAVVNPKDIEDLKTALAELKTKAAEDAKAAATKVDSALKAAKEAKDGLAASEKSAKDALTKAEAAEKAAKDGLAASEKSVKEALAKAEAAEKAATEAKAGGGDKMTALEKGSEEAKKAIEKATADAGAALVTGKERGDSAWMLTSSAFVLLMVPGLALFYGGMVRRKNVLATMMQSMAALAVVGVYWLAVGYALAFGPSVIKLPDMMGVEGGGFVGFSWDLVFLKGVEATDKLPAYDIPVYVHVIFQGMFAIITPALISGAIAERIRFWPFCIFMLLWVTFVYCPLAHMVWAWDWFDPSVPPGKRGGAAIGFFGKMGALDFAGGTVVHIAAGMAGLACCLVLGKRHGYPKMIAHPNSMVLTVLGAGLLWFGWFGFNGGSSLNSSALGGSAFAATQAAAAAAGLAWMLIEWIHKGKPTGLGLASGIVAGLVAVTPASGFVYIGGAVCIGIAASVVCYLAVALKNVLGYDDSLDAFGVHGVGGFVGAILTGVFCSALVQSASTDGLLAYGDHRAKFETLKPTGKDAEGKDIPSKVIKEAMDKAAAADEKAKAKEKELSPKIEELTKAKGEAEKKFADGTPGKRDAEAKALADAKDALKKVESELVAAQDEAAVATGTVDKLNAELATLVALVDKQDAAQTGSMTQLMIQIKASLFSVVYAFVLSLGLCVLTQAITLGNFKASEKGESDGLDRTEHGEVGFDFSGATESVAVVSAEPRAASVPKGNGRFDLQVDGTDPAELMKVWTDLCQPTDDPIDPNFLAVYPYVTTVRGTTFRCRGGDQAEVAKRLSALLTKHLGKSVKAVKV